MFFSSGKSLSKGLYHRHGSHLGQWTGTILFFFFLTLLAQSQEAKYDIWLQLAQGASDEKSFKNVHNEWPRIMLIYHRTPCIAHNIPWSLQLRIAKNSMIKNYSTKWSTTLPTDQEAKSILDYYLALSIFDISFKLFR